MKHIFISTFLILISVSVFAQWTWQNPLPQGNSLRSVCFTDASTAYAAGDWGTILKTTNGGATWTLLSSGTTEYLASVFFPDASTGYVAGTGGTILKTTDSGITWMADSTGTVQHLNSAFFTDASNGYAVGSFGTILKTTNGGTTWIN